MVPVDWASPALADLRGVYDFIARGSRRYAQLTIERIRSAGGRLADFPEIGHVLPEFPDGPYRQVLMGSYRIIYRLEEKPRRVFIMAVIHGARNLAPILKKRLTNLDEKEN
jgi:plasmid stabilization system protein ParE